VKKPTLLQALVRDVLILLILLVLILAPRPAAGYLDLRQARCFDAAGNYAAAAAAYATAAERLPWQLSLWEKAADVYLDGKNYFRAEYYYEIANRRHALSPSGYMGWGDTMFVLGDPRFAVDIWNGLIDKGGNPSVLLPRIARGYQALALNSDDHSLEFYSDEIQAWQKYLVYQPGDAAAHYRLGLLRATTSPVDALPELMQAVRLDPSLDASVQSLRSALNTAILLDDRSYQLLVSGRALGALGDWDLAAEAFRNAIAVRADYAEAWAWLSEAKQQQDQVGSIDIERALAYNPDSAMVQSLYGLYLQRQKQPKKALAAFQKAAALEPENPGWQMALGEAYEQTGDLVAALEHYQSAVELSPNEATFWRALAEFSLRNNVDLTGTGLPAARRLVELANNDWQSDDIAGQILLETDDVVGAEALLKKAIELDPTQVAPSLHLGLLYLQTGNRAAAYSYLNQAKAFDPDGPFGWQAKRLLEQYFP
jgi:tetratricopeptide (TPR) repeat protein